MSYPPPESPYPPPGEPPSGTEGPAPTQPQPSYPGAYPPQGTPPPQGGYGPPGAPPPGGYAPPGGPPLQNVYSPQRAEGDRAAQTALIFGILGFVVAGVVFGPLAIWQASKAENLGVDATAGKVLGWISLILGLLVVGVFVVVFGTMILTFLGIISSV